MTASRFEQLSARLIERAAAGELGKPGVEEEPPAPVADLWVSTLRTLRVPLKYQGVRRDVALPEELATWSGTPWSATLLGPTGTGKTWLAVRLLAEMFLRDRQRLTFSRTKPMFADCSLAIEAILNENFTPNQGNTFRELELAEVLLLDDVFAERDAEFQRDKLSLLLRSRYNHQRPTIITSNQPSLAPIAEQEARIASRLSEGILFIAEGDDLRMPN